MIIQIPEGTLKTRIDNYVVFDVDYLLTHSLKEIVILREEKRQRLIKESNEGEEL